MQEIKKDIEMFDYTSRDIDTSVVFKPPSPLPNNTTDEQKQAREIATSLLELAASEPFDDPFTALLKEAVNIKTWWRERLETNYLLGFSVPVGYPSDALYMDVIHYKGATTPLICLARLNEEQKDAWVMLNLLQ